jgi:AraC-like DNA-binding protein
MTHALQEACFKSYVPRKPLSDFVALFWYWRGQNPTYAHERILPTGTVELIINLKRGAAFEAGLSGPKSTAFTIPRTDQEEFLGVHFLHAGAFPFLGLPTGELHNVTSSLAEIWPSRMAAQFIDQLNEAKTIEGKFHVLELSLMEAATGPLLHDPAVSFAISEFRRDPNLSSAELAERAGFSQRRFIEVFERHVGLKPKLFSRILRFQSVVQAINDKMLVDWLDVALQAGYYDQAHFIHEFQQFSGVSPSNYLNLRTVHPNHLRQ